MKLEISYRKKNGKNTNMWGQNNMLLKNQRVKKEIKEDIRNYFETNENQNTILQNLWETAKEVLRGKFIVIEAYLKKQEKFQANNLTLHLKEIEKEQTKPEVGRRNNIIKIRTEKNETKKLEKINETKS